MVSSSSMGFLYLGRKVQQSLQIALEATGRCGEWCEILFRPFFVLRSEGPKRLERKMTLIWVFPKIGVKPPKWMVKIMETPIKMDDLGGKPTIFGNTHI